MKRILISIMVPFIFLFLLFLVYNSVRERRYIESINTICNTNELPLISEEIYKIGDYNSDSDLIKEIEKNSNWKFQEIYFDDGYRIIYFNILDDKRFIVLGFGGKSGYLSKRYKQEFLEVEVKEGEQKVYRNMSWEDNFILGEISSPLADSKYYTTISNEKLKEFINVYKKAVTNTYCK